MQSLDHFGQALSVLHSVSKTVEYQHLLEALNFDTTWPAAENTHFEGTEVAGMYRNFLANILKKG